MISSIEYLFDALFPLIVIDIETVLVLLRNLDDLGDRILSFTREKKSLGCLFSTSSSIDICSVVIECGFLGLCSIFIGLMRGYSSYPF